MNPVKCHTESALTVDKGRKWRLYLGHPENPKVNRSQRFKKFLCEFRNIYLPQTQSAISSILNGYIHPHRCSLRKSKGTNTSAGELTQQQSMAPTDTGRM